MRSGIPGDLSRPPGPLNPGPCRSDGSRFCAGAKGTLQLHAHYACKARLQRGAGLVSIMIAMFIIMTSVLGYVAMQVRSMRSVTASQLETQAITIASSIADSIRSNEPAALGGRYDGEVTASGMAGACEGIAAVCTAPEMAAYDMTTWRLSLDRLPGGRARIVRFVVPGEGTLLKVAVCWNANREGAGAGCPPGSEENNPPGSYALEVML